MLPACEVPIAKKVYDNATMETEIVDNIYSFRRGKSALNAISWFYEWSHPKILLDDLIFFNTD